MFKYEIGSVETNIAWQRPNSKNVSELIYEIKKLEDYNKYELYLVGGVLNGGLGTTWDVDIIVAGKIVYEDFEKFLDSIYNLALNKIGVCVDIRWYDKPIERLTYLMSKGEKEKFKTVRFGYCKKSIGNHKIMEQNLFLKHKQVTQHLIEAELDFPTKKCLLNTKPKYIRI
jgi:hypothetical protein